MATKIKKWTADAVGRLIDAIQERPCLYNTKLKDYFNRDKRSKAFSEISEIVDFPGK